MLISIFKLSRSCMYEVSSTRIGHTADVMTHDKWEKNHFNSNKDMQA